MVVDPVDTDVDKAEQVARQGRPGIGHGGQAAGCWRMQLKYHDGDDDGDDAIAECLGAVLVHAATLARKTARVPCQGIVVLAAGPRPVLSSFLLACGLSGKILRQSARLRPFPVQERRVFAPGYAVHPSMVLQQNFP
jgi:hypothetical protein